MDERQLALLRQEIALAVADGIKAGLEELKQYRSDDLKLQRQLAVFKEVMGLYKTKPPWSIEQCVDAAKRMLNELD